MGGISEKAARPLICEKNPEVKARAISTTQKKIRPSFLVPPRFRDRGRKPDNCQLPEPEPEPVKPADAARRSSAATIVQNSAM
jgi:hypothetical protein